MKPSARPRIRGGYMSAAATRSCWPALTPMVNTIMPSVRPTALLASIPMPVSSVPSIASPWPNRMPGLRPNRSVIWPIG